MTTMMQPAPMPLLDDEFTAPTLTLEEQCILFTKALTERSESLLYRCIEWLASLKQRDPVAYVRKKIDVKAAFGAAINLRDFLSVLQAEARRQELVAAGTKKDIATTAIEWATQHRDQWGYDPSTHTWYVWVNTHWTQLEEEAGKPSPLDHEAIDALHAAGILVNSNQALNCFRRVAATYCKRAFREEKPDVINFLNGTLDLTTLTMRPHHRDDNFIYCHAYAYHPAGTHPSIDAFLDQTIPDAHARQNLLAFIGLAMLHDTSFHNVIILLGPPRGGKSTVLALGNATCGHVKDAYDFAGPSLFSRDLEGKRSRAIWSDRHLVAVDELPGEALREEELLKLMSAHSGVEMRRIGKDERTDNRWKPKLILSTNDTPHYKDVSGAIRHRALVITCPNGPLPENQQNKNLFTDTLAPEIGAFAATCIQYALALKQRGFFPRSTQMRRTLDEIEHLGNPLKTFIRECCIVEHGAKMTSDLLHKSYVEYVVEGGNSPLAKNKMSSAIRDMAIGVSVGEWMRWNNRPTRCLKGIRLRNDYDGDPEEPVYQDDPLLFPPQNPPPLEPARQGQHQRSEQEDTKLQQVSSEVKNAETDVSSNERPPIEYPASMAYNMEPPPEDSCPTCHQQNYAPFWGKWATKKWGCATCYPQILEKLGLYDIEHLPKE